MHVDAAGDVDGDHGDPCGSTASNTSAASGRNGPRAGDPDDTVDHQIGCCRDTFDDPAAGCGERGQRLGVRAFRFEQYRGGRHAATTQEGGRPQRVAAVVAGADDRADPASGDAAGQQGEFAGDRGGQAVGGAAHQRTVGKARQQRRFCLADLVGGVVVPHRCPRYVPIVPMVAVSGSAPRDAEVTGRRHAPECRGRSAISSAYSPLIACDASA